MKYNDYPKIPTVLPLQNVKFSPKISPQISPKVIPHRKTHKVKKAKKKHKKKKPVIEVDGLSSRKLLPEENKKVYTINNIYIYIYIGRENNRNGKYPSH